MSDAQLNRDAIMSEVMIFVAELFEGRLSAVIAAALRDKDIGQLKILLLAKCRSHFSDKGRDPRYKAIRSILQRASLEGKVLYRAGKGLFSKIPEKETVTESTEQFHWTCFAFGDDSNLTVIPDGLLSSEGYADWPMPPGVGIKSVEDEAEVSLSQKAMVLAAASTFWDEVRQRHGPHWVFVAELQRYIQAAFPPWLLDALLPDPSRLSAMNMMVAHDPDSDRPDWDSGETSVQGENSMLLAEYDRNTYQPPLELLPMQATTERLSQEWFDELGDKRAIIFCLMFHCQLGPTDAAAYLEYNSPQNAHAAFKALEKRLLMFCSLHEGLAGPELDTDLLNLFVNRLHDQCENNVLRGRCP